MKYWGLLAALAAVIASGLQSSAKPLEYAIFLSGNAQGYLSPCGCSAPMIGGTKRRATAIEQFGIKGRTILLENGGLIKTSGRQDEIKLETFAQLHASAHGAGMNLTPSEAAVGPGAILSMVRLSGGRLLSSNLPNKNALETEQSRIAGPFVIAGLSNRSRALASQLNQKPVETQDAITGLLASPLTKGKSQLIILDGDRTEAIALAKRFPGLSLIQYQSSGRPSAKAERIGNVLIASPGDGGRYLVRLVWRTNRFTSYSSIELDPSFVDEKRATAIYKTYLARISEEQLLEAMPRKDSAKFSGNQECGSCHSESSKIWKDSKHAMALHTLEKEGHDRDPDCVECHVVGLASIYGFQSRALTPSLADVGCESCHGPGKNHSNNPRQVKMGPIGPNSCMPCHRTENSPKFDFATYWPKIRHK